MPRTHPLVLATPVLALALLLPLASPAHAAQSDDWVARSNENAQLLLEVFAEFSPEGAGRIGVDGLDQEVRQLPLDLDDRVVAAVGTVRGELAARLEKETDPQVRLDLEILIDACDDSIRETELEHRLELPYFDLHQVVFQGIRGLLDDQIPEERRAAAVVRLKKYAGLAEGYTPIAAQAEATVRARLDEPELLAPFRDDLEKDLANAPRFVGGLGELFERYQLDGWQEPLAALTAQLDGWESFVRGEVVPRAREDFRLPEELYALALDDSGIDMPVEELTSRAKTSFREIQNEMQVLASLVAAERGLPSSDYRDVLAELKKDQLVGDAILPHYQQRIRDLEERIRTSGMLTLPERPMQIRLASEAESAATPAPNMRPPRMIGNTGERGEFVLPLRIPSADGSEEIGFDDFTFAAASWTLTAHEGRPGHELQFSSMIETGVSTARMLFALNSTNVEGWALYAETEMKPTFPLDGQLVGLQHRLLRAARAFLDPGLQLGQITREEAYRVLQHDVVLSEAMAQQEVERYTFRSPGQAPSYFCGYQRLMELRTDVELAQGDAFDKKAFHDFVLAQGALPPKLLRKAVMERFVGAAD